MKLLDDLKHLLLAKKALDRLKEAGKMGHLKVVAYGLGGAILTAVVASVTGACPGLVASLPAIGTALVGSVVTFYMRKPLTAPGVKASVTAIGGFVIATALEQLKATCGADFIHQIPTLALAGVWVGLGLYLKAPHESTTVAPKV